MSHQISHKKKTQINKEQQRQHVKVDVEVEQSTERLEIK